MEEIWKNIPGYEGLYQVSNFGNVKSFNGRWSNEPKVLKFKFNRKNGYLSYILCKNGNQKTYYAHQLVAIVFLNHQTSSHKIVVNHIDHNKLNNHVSNLEIVTQRYNATEYIKDVGVYLYRNKWSTMIKIEGKKRYLGSFDNKEKALQIYQTALNNIHLFDGDSSNFRKVISQLSF